MKDKIKLKWKVFAFLLGFCALLLIILWLMQTVFLNDMYRFIRTRELKAAISTVEKEINNPKLGDILTELQNEKDIHISFTMEFIMSRRSGQVIFATGGVSRDDITEIREFTFENGQTISLTFYALTVPVTATVMTLRYQLFLVSGIMLVLAVALAVIIAKRVSKPIEDISRSAQLLAKGDYDTEFTGKGFREICVLSDTLNTAAFELGRVEALRRELMANVSHDLRTPLALIYSYAEMMNDFPGEITPEQAGVIMEETRRLATLVNDVLDISKLESDMENLECVEFNLTDMVSETAGRMSELLKADDFLFNFSYDEEIYVKGDKAKLDRVFYNLLINAVNYSGDDKTVTVTQTIADNIIRISVSDNGEGIAEEELPHIWDRYYKSNKSHKRAVTGTGLGLSIVKKIMELHKGGYGVMSEIGRGSTFWFELRL